MRLEHSAPFGLRVTLAEGTRFDELAPDLVKGWLAEHRVVVIRGLAALDKRHLPLAARRLGPLQAWSFGAVNVLKVDPDKQNYLFTEGEVPLHWDGAFKGEIPSTLMFRCVEAPPDGAGGATVFVDGARVWEGLDEPTRQRWSRACFRYATERVVHYGGTFDADLVSRHPTTGATTLRFAEPVEGLNPVTVEALHEGSPTVAEVASALADPAIRLAHHWRVGDVLLADNHALLHGRDAFVAHAPRELHRVNVLDGARPWYRGLLDSVRIRRPEFMVAEVPILLFPLLWVAPDAAWLGRGAFWEATAVFFLLFHFGDMVNCLADRELDAVYKTTLSEAVFGLGVRNVAGQIAASAALALLLTTHLAWSAGRPWLVPLVVVGLVLGHQYSYGPLKLKSRGLWQIPTLWALIFVGPVLLTTGVVAGWPSPSLLALIGLYGAMAQLIILVNTAEDFDEDVAAGLHTSAIALGRKGAVWTSAIGVGLAGGGLFALFGATAMAEDWAGPTWWVLGLWTCAWSWSTLEIGHLAWRVQRARAPDAELKRGAAKMPVWITVVAWLTLGVVAARAWLG
ncbi:MAG: TauD/TfdA family dioxygenase [Myxococcales bacterium]|nr:TauD/TfdA family dioxygenase [Myxococcales bacterium]